MKIVKVGRLDQLKQLLTVTPDGDLICKDDRDGLYARNLSVRMCGMNVISQKGIEYLCDLGLIKP